MFIRERRRGGAVKGVGKEMKEGRVKGEYRGIEVYPLSSTSTFEETFCRSESSRRIKTSQRKPYDSKEQFGRFVFYMNFFYYT